MRNIFGYGISARKMRARAGIETLALRRFNACKKFAQDLASNPRFSDWMTRRPDQSRGRREMVDYMTFVEHPARTSRCYNSPLYYY